MVQSQRASRQAVLFVYEPNSFVPLTTVQSKYLALRLWWPTVRRRLMLLPRIQTLVWACHDDRNENDAANQGQDNSPE